MGEMKVGDGPPMDIAAHTPGVNQGNAAGNAEKEPGFEAGEGTASARFSTGVNAKAREPIDPSMPNLPPG